VSVVLAARYVPIKFVVTSVRFGVCVNGCELCHGRIYTTVALMFIRVPRLCATKVNGVVVARVVCVLVAPSSVLHICVFVEMF
jgi:hypothetical protein